MCSGTMPSWVSDAFEVSLKRISCMTVADRRRQALDRGLIDLRMLEELRWFPGTRRALPEQHSIHSIHIENVHIVCHKQHGIVFQRNIFKECMPARKIKKKQVLIEIDLIIHSA